jgi:glycosyltransferase involved in cell wall biosynthesis
VRKVLADWISHLDVLKQSLPVESIEILVVDDGSTDGGCEDLGDEWVTVLRHPVNRGYGQSLKTGLLQASGEWVVFHDCDDTCKAADLVNLWRRKDGADLVVGQRINHRTGMPPLRKFGNRLYQSLFRLFFGAKPHDLCSGYRLFHRKWVASFTEELPDQLNFTLAMSLWMTLRGFKVVEAPIHYAERIGASKLSAWRDGWRFLFTIFRYRLRSLPKQRVSP